MRLIILFCLMLASGIPAYAANRSECRQGRGSVTKKIHGFKIQIAPYPDKSNPDLDECEAEIYDPRGDVIFSEHHWGFAILLAGVNVNGDGIPDVVLEAFSGGMHCCWTYYFFSLGPRPGLLLKFENNRDASFFWGKKPGQIYMEIQDGAFDYFDGLCHGCTTLPVVFLRLEGTRLVDISLEHRDVYDDMIVYNRKALKALDVNRVVSMKQKPTESPEVNETVWNILMIVLSYFYSGREEQARRELHAMWPEFDRERMWKLIHETRRDGILCYTRKDAACGPDAASE